VFSRFDKLDVLFAGFIVLALIIEALRISVNRPYAALKQARANVTFYKIAGAGHGGPAFDSDMMRAAVLAFLDKHLKPHSNTNP
jgi:hypothetical protein